MTDDTNNHDEQGLDVLLDYLKRTRGFDFLGYKRATVTRRVQKRMQAVRVQNYADYVDYLEVHPDEFVELFNTILINVTSFFRDPDNWEYLRREIIPRLLQTRQAGASIRVWVPGCATGDEPFSIALLFAEALGLERYRERVKIYATDMDEEALAKARQALYTAKEIADVPEELVAKYFEPVGHLHAVAKDVRRGVIFGRHNLIQDAPISRLDLISCRNTLMYFNADTQSKILARFHYALNEGGFLFVGKAEMLFTHGNTFAPVDLRRRVFTTVPRAGMRERLLMMVDAGDTESNGRISSFVKMREAAFEVSPVAQVIVDADGKVAMINDLARSTLNLSLRDVGRPLQDLEISYRPLELRSLIEQAHSERRTVETANVLVAKPGAAGNVLDIRVTPLADPAGYLLGTALSFVDVTHSKRLQDELVESNQELETAYEELQSTSEELETTNEELQSTVEELETTNEELQSTNDELETMNEELQSTNEELQSINDELHQRSEELNQANDFVNSIVSSLHGGIIVLDQDLHVRVWNSQSEEMWGLRSDEVQGKNFLNLGIGLPVEVLQQPIRGILASPESGNGFEKASLDAVNRRGKAVRCDVSLSPLRTTAGQLDGVVIVVETE